MRTLTAPNDYATMTVTSGESGTTSMATILDLPFEVLLQIVDPFLPIEITATSQQSREINSLLISCKSLHRAISGCIACKKPILTFSDPSQIRLVPAMVPRLITSLDQIQMVNMSLHAEPEKQLNPFFVVSWVEKPHRWTKPSHPGQKHGMRVSWHEATSRLLPLLKNLRTLRFELTMNSDWGRENPRYWDELCSEGLRNDRALFSLLKKVEIHGMIRTVVKNHVGPTRLFVQVSVDGRSPGVAAIPAPIDCSSILNSQVDIQVSSVSRNPRSLISNVLRSMPRSRIREIVATGKYQVMEQSMELDCAKVGAQAEMRWKGDTIERFYNAYCQYPVWTQHVLLKLVIVLTGGASRIRFGKYVHPRRMLIRSLARDLNLAFTLDTGSPFVSVFVARDVSDLDEYQPDVYRPRNTGLDISFA